MTVRTATLLIGCAATAALSAGCAGDPVSAEAVVQAVPDPDAARFDVEIAGFVGWDDKNSPPDDAIVFVGSSSIRFWNTALSFPNRKVVNRGFGGSHMSDVNQFVQETVLKHHPAVVVFYAGDNDVWAGKREAQLLQDFTEFVDTVHADDPSTPIIFVGIKPSPARWSVWQDMQDANQVIRAYVDSDPLLHYADVAATMLGTDGQPIPGLFVSDGLHMTPAGYQTWTNVLGAVLTDLGW